MWRWATFKLPFSGHSVYNVRRGRLVSWELTVNYRSSSKTKEKKRTQRKESIHNERKKGGKYGFYLLFKIYTHGTSEPQHY